MLQYHRDAETYMKTDAANTFNATATRPVTTRKVDAWRDFLTLDQIAIVEKICAEEMDAHGYRPLRPRRTMGSRIGTTLESTVKVAYWHIQNWRHRHIRHYTVRSQILARSRSRLAALRSSWRWVGQAASAHPSHEREPQSQTSEVSETGGTDNVPLSEAPRDDDPKVGRGVARNRPGASDRHVR
jgi:hypothetical protein